MEDSVTNANEVANLIGCIDAEATFESAAVAVRAIEVKIRVEFCGPASQLPSPSNCLCRLGDEINLLHNAQKTCQHMIYTYIASNPVRIFSVQGLNHFFCSTSGHEGAKMIDSVSFLLAVCKILIFEAKKVSCSEKFPPHS